jgi:hypothetical protein
VIPDNITITDLNLLVDVSHTWVGDLKFVLQRVDSATSTTPIDRPGYTGSGFGCSGNDIDATIDDEGTDGNVETTCLAAVPTIAGDLVGGDPPNASLLAAYDGMSAQATWRLTVSDNAGGDTGALNQWCVEVSGGGGDPNIFVDPLSMSSTQATNVQVQQTLTISNTGGGTLNWDIDEEDTTLPVIDAPAILTPQPAAEVMGAPEGAAPEAAQSQPALWRGPAALLYDNGPQVTHPGGGAGGADASAVQTGLGNSTYGFGHAVSSGFRMADDFTVPAGGWNVDTITFFAYQTGSTTASTINAVNVRIWDGPPNAGGSVVWGDTTTNRLASSAWSNIYRVLDTALTNNQRPVMADVATIGTFLPAGTYWVDWQTGGTLTSGPWAHPVTILGQTAKPGSNGLQYNPTTSTWGPAIDTGAAAQQDLPFIVEGTAGGSVDPCTALADIPWLTLSPASGANAGGTATGVTVTFDSTSMAAGGHLHRQPVRHQRRSLTPGPATRPTW